MLGTCEFVLILPWVINLPVARQTFPLGLKHMRLLHGYQLLFANHQAISHACKDARFDGNYADHVAMTCFEKDARPSLSQSSQAEGDSLEFLLDILVTVWNLRREPQGLYHEVAKEKVYSQDIVSCLQDQRRREMLDLCAGGRGSHPGHGHWREVPELVGPWIPP